MKNLNHLNYSLCHIDSETIKNAIDLLSKHAIPGTGEDIHLDFNLGLYKSLKLVGCKYVGVCFEKKQVETLAQTDNEGSLIDVSQDDLIKQSLLDIIGKRRVRSISLIGVIDQLASPQNFLKILVDVARHHNSYFIISCNNITHYDIGAEVLNGAWRYTDNGIINKKSTHFFSKDSFQKILETAGLLPVDYNNLIIADSEQHVPHDHAFFTPHSSLNVLLRNIVDKSNPYNQTYRFVWGCEIGNTVSNVEFIDPVIQSQQPFLSVIMRTQGKRIHTLREVLTSLFGQSDDDFELLLLGHCLSEDARSEIQQLLSYYPECFTKKVRLIEVNEGNRTRPLNVGFSAANGSYISILDDDDIPFAHWVETFKSLAKNNCGKVLRASCVVQDIENVAINYSLGVRATGSLQSKYPSSFDFISHFHTNETPPSCLSFPRSVYQDLNIHFDETLTTTEDWDFILSNIAITGVASSPVITSVYHWWTKDESSRTLHNDEEWSENYQKIIKKHYAKEIILPAGVMADLMTRLYATQTTQNIVYSNVARQMPIPLTPSIKRMFFRSVKSKIIILKVKKIFCYFSKKMRKKIRRQLAGMYELKSFLNSLE